MNTRKNLTWKTSAEEKNLRKSTSEFYNKVYININNLIIISIYNGFPGLYFSRKRICFDSKHFSFNKLVIVYYNVNRARRAKEISRDAEKKKHEKTKIVCITLSFDFAFCVQKKKKMDVYT
jgi:hypothetical protein